MTAPRRRSQTESPSATPANADDIILFLGREIGRLFVEQQQLETRATTDPMTRSYLDREANQITERLWLLKDSLSGTSATGLAAATIQCAAACETVGHLTDNGEIDSMRGNALLRLLSSVNRALLSLVADEGTWRSEHGLDYLFPGYRDPWNDVDHRLTEARSGMGC